MVIVILIYKRMSGLLFDLHASCHTGLWVRNFFLRISEIYRSLTRHPDRQIKATNT